MWFRGVEYVSPLQRCYWVLQRCVAKLLYSFLSSGVAAIADRESVSFSVKHHYSGGNSIAAAKPNIFPNF